MTMLRKFAAALLAALMFAPALAPAQDRFSQPELDRLLAPVALYPDPLLSQVLMAATYPADLVEAARWSRANPQFSGDDAVRAADRYDWDPSVKSLLAFPQLLQRMDEDLQWTRSLGEAFLAQEPHVMDTVQQLRRRAHAAGNLRSDERLLVQPQGQTIAISPYQPQLLYVPYYDPLVVYGQWWWPGYQPVYWAPWPGYVRAHRPGYTMAFWWGTPVHLSQGFFFGNLDWHYRQVRVVHVQSHYVHVHRHVHLAPGHWRRAGRPERAVVERRVVERPVVERRVVERPVVERRVVAVPTPIATPAPVPVPAAAPIIQAPPQRVREERREFGKERLDIQRAREPRREPARVQTPAVVVAPVVAAPVVAAPAVAAPAIAAPVAAQPAVAAPTVQRPVDRATPRTRGEPRGEERNERPRKGG